MRVCCPADWLPLCCLCRLHAAAVLSLCSVPHLLLYLLFVFVCPSWMLCQCTATSQRISHFLLSLRSIPSSRLSRCLFRNKEGKRFSGGCFFSTFSLRMLPPPERSLFPVLTLSLCRGMSRSSPGCFPLTPTANHHQLLLHTAHIWRAKRCSTSPSDICAAGGSESLHSDLGHVVVKCH